VSQARRRRKAEQRRAAAPKTASLLSRVHPVSACSYGVHPFVYQKCRGVEGYHYHHCPECGAVYFEKGEDPCYVCKPGSATVDA
jgi:hypothetical protein